MKNRYTKSLALATVGLLGLVHSAGAQILPPLAYFPFDETVGETTAVDSTTNNHDGTVNNAVVFGGAAAPGAFSTGGSANFTGGNAFLNLTTFDSHAQLRDNPRAGLGSYTLAVWLRPSGLVGDQFFFGQTNQGIHDGIQGSRLRHAHWGADYSGGTTLTANTWIHAAYTYDGVTNTGTIYLNGVQDGTSSQNPPNGGGTMILGARDNGQGGFTGDADDAVIWGDVLTAAEITALAGGADPLAGVADTDADNLPDGYEMHHAGNLTDLSGLAGNDFDTDGLTDLAEYTTHETSPVADDTDSDMSKDGNEVNTASTDPLIRDSDGDGLLDGVETNTGTFVDANDTGTDPNNVDTDGDLVSDGVEVNAVTPTDPTDPSSSPPIPAPYAYWDFEGDTGTTLTDKSANSFDAVTDGTQTAVTLGAAGAPYGPTGTTGGTFSVGGNGFMTVAGIDAVNDIRNNGGAGAGSYTMTAWIKPAATNGNRHIFGQQSQGIHNGLQNGKVRMSHWGADHSGTTDITTDAWQHIAYVYDGGADRGQIYVNGKADGPLQGKNAPNNNTAPNLLLLGTSNGGGSYYTGDLDELALWRSTLNGLDIARLAAGGSPISDPAADSDDDGLPDAGELRYAGNLTDLNGTGDFDSDTITDFDEVLFNGTDPTKADTDADGLNDNVESNTGTYVSAADTGTDPLVGDTDNDGLLDGVETNTGTLVDANDTGTNPNVADTDSDTVTDGLEVQLGSDPNDINSLPTIPAPLVYFDFEDNQDCVVSDPGGNTMRGYQRNNFSIVSGGAPSGPSPSNAGEFSVGGDGFLELTGLDVNSMLRDVPSANNGSYTLSAWIKPNAETITAGEGFIFGQTSEGIHNGLRNGNKLNSAHWGADWVATTTLTVDTWVHAVWTYDGVADRGTIYVNGVQDGTSAQNSWNGGGNLIIGARNNGQAPFKGHLDDVAVWDLVLPQAFITDLATNARSPIEKYAPDTDADSLPDLYEINTAGDLTTLNGDDIADFDNDGLSDRAEYLTTRTNPTLSDTDNDGMSDGVETNTGIYASATDTGTNPLLGMLDQWDCDTELTTDEDGDSLDNILEFAFGTDPFVSDNVMLETTGSGNVSPGTPSVQITEDSTTPYTARFVRRQTHEADGLTYSVEFSSDMVAWETSAETPTVVASENGLDVVEVPYSYFLTTGRKAQFFRVSVTYNP